MSDKQERTCIACRQHKQQYEMLRVARIENQYILDEKFKLGGRGAYICKEGDCLDKTIKKHLLNRAFKTNVPQDIYNQLGDYEKNN